jgi:hypothetical protein
MSGAAGRPRPRPGLLTIRVQHARHLDDLAQLQLAPAPAHLGPAQSLHEVRGLGLQGALVVVDRADEAYEVACVVTRCFSGWVISR